MKFYVVWLGREPGIYGSWPEAEKQTRGFKGARFKSFATYSEAEQAYADGWEEYYPKSIKKAIKTVEELPENALFVETQKGPEGEFVVTIIDSETGNEMYIDGPYYGITSALAKYIGAGIALYLLEVDGESRPVVVDSMKACYWIKVAKCGSNHRYTQDEKAARLIESTTRWLREHKTHSPVVYFADLKNVLSHA
jgi:ribonuclease HI